MMRFGGSIIIPIIPAPWIIPGLMKRSSRLPVVLFTQRPMYREIGSNGRILDSDPLMPVADLDIRVILDPRKGGIEDIVILDILGIFRPLLRLEQKTHKQTGKHR
jgi:hypothetical protein